MSLPPPDDWIDLAMAHGSTKWLKQFIRNYLPQLQANSIAPAALAQALMAEFETRGLHSLAQQKNYRSNVVQALKVIDEQHPAIALVAPTAQEYQVLNEAQWGRLVERETQYITAQQAEQLVERAAGLLASAQWSEVGAGLAVLVGRRISEILLSEFSLQSPWSLNFSNMAKHADAKELTIEIPTLVPAQGVLEAILKLQQGLKIEDLKVQAVIAKIAKQKVNARFSAAIAAQCQQQFAGLVPPRSGKDDLYTHLFRAVYATIAAYWFCPPQVPEHTFKAEIQGHFTIGAAGQKLPNFSARANYDDYAIGDGQGNRDGRLGIKLGTLPQLEVLEVFRKSEASPGPAGLAIESEGGEDGPAEAGSGLAASDDRAWRGPARVEGWGQEVQSPETGAERHLEALDLSTANAIRFRAANLLASARVSPAQRLVALQILSGLSVAQLGQASIKTIDPFVLEVDGVPVRTLVQHLRPQIDQLRQQPLPLPQEVEPIVQALFEDLPVPSLNLQQLYLLLAHPAKSDVSTMTIAKAKHKRPDLYADDLDHMHALMARYGIGGNAAEVFHALLAAFEQGQVLQHQQHSQTLAEVAQTFNWFTAEIEHLRGQIQALQQERDQIKDNRSAAEESERLRAENQRLRTQLQQTQARLEGIQQWLDASDQRTTSSGGAEKLNDAIEPTLNRPGESAVALTPVARPTAGPTPVPLAAPPTRRGHQETASTIHQIIDALLAWNSAQDDSQHQLRISIPIVKEMATPLGANYQPVIQQVLKDRQQELELHHAQFMLGVRHNASVPQKQQLLSAIAHRYGPQSQE